MEVLRKIICILLLFNVYTAKAQLDILRFSTFYASYSTNTPQIGDPSFMVQGTEPDNPYDFVPNFVDGELIELTPQYAPNVILTLGIRKIARFDYQIKQNNFYTGNEHQATTMLLYLTHLDLSIYFSILLLEITD